MAVKAGGGNDLPGLALFHQALCFVPHLQEHSLRCASRTAPHMCQLCLIKTVCCFVSTYIQSRILIIGGGKKTFLSGKHAKFMWKAIRHNSRV